MERLQEERWKTDWMDDEISGGNGFQEYLMNYRWVDEVGLGGGVIDQTDL